MMVAGVLALCGCVDSESSCPLDRTCELCTMEVGCAWCFETGACNTSSTVCPGEVAFRFEQCEAEARVETESDPADTTLGSMASIVP